MVFYPMLCIVCCKISHVRSNVVSENFLYFTSDTQVLGLRLFGSSFLCSFNVFHVVCLCAVSFVFSSTGTLADMGEVGQSDWYYSGRSFGILAIRICRSTIPSLARLFAEKGICGFM